MMNTNISKQEYNIFQNVGVVTGVADGIVSILGISNVAYGETVDILTGDSIITCLVLNLEYGKVNAIVLDADINIKPGQIVICSGILMRVPTGDSLLGRIIDPLGKPVDMLVLLFLVDFVWLNL